MKAAQTPRDRPPHYYKSWAGERLESNRLKAAIALASVTKQRKPWRLPVMLSQPVAGFFQAAGQPTLRL
ncbi:hypothetical protein [Halomicronema sp. CCY15110]|uniref:hypothetical protein n=1 Tax=Halomicronema sp. CCY15110 TaxID=2767773 RepID=UPI00194EE352|nr:hypothetical protein [Halomicronema sp. CCY15110]